MAVERKHFLATIAAHPLKDAPRLVFADWLEERGECAEAERIRIAVKNREHRRRPLTNGLVGFYTVGEDADD
jgi:uncharacterized protein (TIGR02996 family)